MKFYIDARKNIFYQLESTEYWYFTTDNRYIGPIRFGSLFIDKIRAYSSFGNDMRLLKLEDLLDHPCNPPPGFPIKEFIRQVLND